MRSNAYDEGSSKRARTSRARLTVMQCHEAACRPFPAPFALPAVLKPLLMLVGIAAAVAAGVFVALWSKGPSYSLLYANWVSRTRRRSRRRSIRGIPYQLDGSNGDLRAGRARQRRAPEARRPGPARRRRRLRGHVEGSRLRRQPVHGRRALPARARNRAGAHDRQPAGPSKARACISRCRASPRSCATAGRPALRCSCS